MQGDTAEFTPHHFRSFFAAKTGKYAGCGSSNVMRSYSQLCGRESLLISRSRVRAPAPSVDCELRIADCRLNGRGGRSIKSSLFHLPTGSRVDSTRIPSSIVMHITRPSDISASKSGSAAMDAAIRRGPDPPKGE